jgi:hypothetical protein
MDADDLASLGEKSNAQTVFNDEDDEDDYEDDDMDDEVSSMGDDSSKIIAMVMRRNRLLPKMTRMRMMPWTKIRRTEMMILPFPLLMAVAVT